MRQPLVLFFVLFSLFICTACNESNDVSVDSTSSSAAADETQQESSQGYSQTSSGGNHLRFQRAPIVDSTGFGRNIIAAHLLIPAGWQTRGGVMWQLNQSGCGKNNPHFAWSAGSPDGKSVVEILPEETWGGNNLGVGQQTSCPNIWIDNIQDYLSTWVKHSRSSATIRNFQPRPDIAKRYPHFNRTDPFPGGEVRQWIEAGQVVLDYQYEGQAYEEVVALAVVFSLSTMQGVMPGEIRKFLTMSSLPGFAMRTPSGELNLKVAEIIRNSGQPNPEWQGLMQQHNAKIASINRKGAMDRHRIRMQTNREIMQMNQDSFEYRQKVQDEGHRKFVQSIREVQDYVDPSTNEKFELPNSYENAWRLKDDTYILTDDHDFDPYRELGVEGQRLNSVR